jgi:hypothetical protein
MRQNTPPSPALGLQLAEWRRPLADDPTVDDAVLRMLRALDRTLPSERRAGEEDAGVSRAAAD